MPRIGALTGVLLVLLVGAAPAAAQSYDPFDTQSLNAGPDGTEVPYEGVEQQVFLTPEFDTSGYSVQTGERGQSTFDHTTCLGFNNERIFGGRTGWARFVSRVSGHVEFRAETPTYDSVIWLRKGPRRAAGQSTFSEILNINCSDAVVGNGSQYVTQRMDPNETVHLQVAGVCARSTNPSSAESCPDPNVAPGGPTRMRVIFTPDNRDGDGVADTLDACPDEAGPTENNGCSGAPTPPRDSDGDGIADADDDCPDKHGPAQDRPRNGCPNDGVLPPDVRDNCPPGMGITSLEFPAVTINARAYATNDPRVTLGVAWPLGATRIHVANDGSGPWVPFPVQPCIDWTLETSGEALRESRTVYVRYTGSSLAPSAPLTDDIILERLLPVVRDAEVQPAAGANRRKAALVATDRGAGVARLDLYRGKRVVRRIDVCRDTTKKCRGTVERSLVVARKQAPESVRVIDGAGNESAVKIFQWTRCRNGTVRKRVGNRFVCVPRGGRRRS